MRKGNQNGKTQVNTRFRILMIISCSVLAIFFANSYYNYRLSYDQLQEQVQFSLQSIVKTVASELDGNDHRTLFGKYIKKDEISLVYQDSMYYSLYKTLKAVKESNTLQSELYTLVYNPAKRTFETGVSSCDQPNYRHIPETPSLELQRNYDLGGILPIYRDHSGEWLSAFAPLRDSHGNTVALVVAERNFSLESEQLRSRKIQMALNIIITITAILFVMYIIVNPLLRKEEIYQQLLLLKNNEWKASVTYARKIQESILPEEKQFTELFSEVFILNQPKDIVSGDMLWSHKTENFGFVAVIDCTGHGVPGAFVTFLAYDALNKIVVDEGERLPSKILERLDNEITKTLSCKNPFGYSDGLDIGIARFDFLNSKLVFSGARHNMLMVNGEPVLFKGTRRSIGENGNHPRIPFLDKTKTFEKNDNFYLWTDGLPDQFGGVEDTRLTTKRLLSILDEVSGFSLRQQKHILEYKLDHWRNYRDQVDDMLLVGLRV